MLHIGNHTFSFPFAKEFNKNILKPHLVNRNPRNTMETHGIVSPFCICYGPDEV